MDIQKINLILQSVNLTVLFLTFGAIAGNTIVTWKLKNLTSKQITFSIKPIVICEINNGTCTIRNVGNGTALYIHGEKTPISMPIQDRKSLSIPNEFNYVSLGERTCLEANSQWTQLSVKLLDDKDKSEGISSQVQQYIFSGIKRLTLHYQDIEQTKYKTELKNQNGNFIVTKFS